MDTITVARRCQLLYGNILSKWRSHAINITALQSNRPYTTSVDDGPINEKSVERSKNGIFDTPPQMPEPDLCCKEGCHNCVWLKYLIEIKNFRENNTDEITKALDCIPDPSIRTFVEMEIKKDLGEIL